MKKTETLPTPIQYAFLQNHNDAKVLNEARMVVLRRVPRVAANESSYFTLCTKALRVNGTLKELILSCK